MSRRCFVAVLCAMSSGCSLDWTVGGGVSDARADASVDHMAPPGSEASTDGPAPPGDAKSDGATCAQLEVNVDAAMAAAKKCTSMPTDCMSHVTTQCGCKVFVAQASSAATSSYLQAIQALQRSGCPIECASCPAPPSQSLCLVNAGLGTSCTP